MDDLISRQAVLKKIEKIRQGAQMMDDTRRASIIMKGMYLCEKAVRNQPSEQPDLIAKIQNGINATNTNDSYSCGMRNGMRWCMSLIDDKEPSFENCPSAQPEIIRCKDCKYSEHWYRDKSRCFLWSEIGIDVFDDGFCNYAGRRDDG